MKTWQIELIERLYDLANKYYTEETDNKALKIPDDQPERQFIQEVFLTCGHVLEDLH